MKERRIHACAAVALVAALLLATSASAQSAARPRPERTDRAAQVARSIGVDASIRDLVSSEMTGTADWRAPFASLGRYIVITPLISTPVPQTWDALDRSPVRACAYPRW